MEPYPAFWSVLMVGLLFSPLAGLAGFLITYEEYSHHGLGRRRTVLMSLEAGFWSAFVMLLVALVGGFFISRWGT